MATVAEVERLVAGPLAGSIANSRHVWTYDVCVAEPFRSSGVQPHAVRERGGSNGPRQTRAGSQLGWLRGWARRAGMSGSQRL